MTTENKNINFDATVSSSDVKKALYIPVVDKKNTKTKPVGKNIHQAALSSLNSLVKVEDLAIDLSYQRMPNELKVNSIVRDFDPDAVGVFIVSAREDGTIAVIDGGHRLAALRMLNMNHMNVNCLVYFGLSVEQEAQIFKTMNDNRTKPKTNDLFKAKVVANDADAREIDKILNKYGLSVSNGPAMNAVRAIGTITAIYKRSGGVVLDQTISVLKTAFDSHSSTFSDQALLAVSTLFDIYGNGIDFNRVFETLKGYGSTSAWSSKGSSVAKQGSFKHMYIGMLFVFCGDYNKRLKKNKIDFNTLIK
jgi:hypothetical protein